MEYFGLFFHLPEAVRLSETGVPLAKISGRDKVGCSICARRLLLWLKNVEAE
jgi:hypothetical protein